MLHEPVCYSVRENRDHALTEVSRPELLLALTPATLPGLNIQISSSFNQVYLLSLLNLKLTQIIFTNSVSCPLIS
jgi:hypothetical protein